MKKKVIILGGGVAGMTAAHELIDRGFDVTVYERKSVAGGKARSVDFPNTGTDKRKPLPGEHGFRFFPSYYKHITDTMKRIPYRNNRNGVYDNLVETARVYWARSDSPPLITLARFPRSLADLRVLANDFFHTDVALTDEEKQFFANRLWQFLTTCEERRLDEYERLPWWEYIGAHERSDNYQKLLAQGLTRSLVAAQAQRSSTKTLGGSFVQLVLAILKPGISSDRVLNGPTNDVWINPWLTYLRARGVQYHIDHRIDAIHCVDDKIKSITVTDLHTKESFEAQGDYYLAALPVEVMATLLTDSIFAADPTLKSLCELKKHTAWMNGIQFYLRERVDIVHGHVLYVDSPWALTSISQKQFWRDVDLAAYGDGTVNDVLSVDISDWTEKGLNGKRAMDCTPEEINNDVWTQLQQSLNVEGKQWLTDANRHSWFLDEDIHSGQTQKIRDTRLTAQLFNSEPLLINEINTWDLRPNASTRIPNLFLAADYVRTNTDLATMEGANEAARRAVNCIIDASGSSVSYCKIWPLSEPLILGWWRWRDRRRFKKGLPWKGKPPRLVQTLADIFVIVYVMIRRILTK
jgi:uncharacterized protein with NAD-binding domain and iron-sulfur cluster